MVKKTADTPPDEEPSLESLLEAKSDDLPLERAALRESQQLARLDPVRRYLLEISRFEPLTAEEERRLALLHREQEDQQAAYQLITSNLQLVVKVARLYNRIYSNVMDLIQEGNIGLMEAVKRFDPDKGARLPTYATWWIKAYIIKFIMDNFRIVRVGTTNERRKILFNLRKEKEKLRLQGIEPTPTLIAKRLNVSVGEVRELEHTVESSDLSLNASVDSEHPVEYVESLTATEERIDEQLARGELKELFDRNVQEFAQSLNDRERAILFERLIADEPKTLQKIADQFQVTREAIRLTEKKLISKVKTHMELAFADVTQFELDLIR